MEVWDGRFGPGPLIAEQAMGRAVALAARHGIACVSVRCTNHWLRPGRYGLAAADAGMAAILFTNTSGNMPAWGRRRPPPGQQPHRPRHPPQKGPHPRRYGDEPVRLRQAGGRRPLGQKTAHPRGFDQDGNLTDDPAAILDSHRILPTGYWKGAAMSLALDCMTAALSMAAPSASSAATVCPSAASRRSLSPSTSARWSTPAPSTGCSMRSWTTCSAPPPPPAPSRSATPARTARPSPAKTSPAACRSTSRPGRRSSARTDRRLPGASARPSPFFARPRAAEKTGRGEGKGRRDGKGFPKAKKPQKPKNQIIK